MPDPTDDRDDTTDEGEAKPTITIAEKQGSGAAGVAEKPTITIAEKEEGED